MKLGEYIKEAAEVKKKVKLIRNSKLEKENKNDRTSYRCFYLGKEIGRFDLLKDDVLKGKKEIYIEVSPEFRGKGYSKLIYEAVNEHFKGETLYAVVDKENTTSIKLHTKLFGKPTMRAEAGRFLIFKVDCV